MLRDLVSVSSLFMPFTQMSAVGHRLTAYLQCIVVVVLDVSTRAATAPAVGQNRMKQIKRKRLSRLLPALGTWPGAAWASLALSSTCPATTVVLSQSQRTTRWFLLSIPVATTYYVKFPGASSGNL